MGSINTQIEDRTFKNVDTKDLFSLTGRTIIVTGATGGLGVQVVRAVLQSGGDVIAIDRAETPTVSSWADLEAIAKSHSCQLSYHPCDIVSSQLTQSVFETATAASRHPLRGLVNCAGVGWVGPSIDFPADEARKIIDVNLVGSLIVAQEAAKIVRKQGGKSASFVFIASMSGYITNKATPTTAYSASKAAVHQLTRSLAGEWGGVALSQGFPEIRVNAISPGVIRTPMTKEVLANAEHGKVWEDESMLKRLSEPEEYRGAVVFLLSDASSYVTGMDLLVDGGSTAW